MCTTTCKFTLRSKNMCYYGIIKHHVTRSIDDYWLKWNHPFHIWTSKYTNTHCILQFVMACRLNSSWCGHVSEWPGYDQYLLQLTSPGMCRDDLVMTSTCCSWRHLTLLLRHRNWTNACTYLSLGQPACVNVPVSWPASFWWRELDSDYTPLMTQKKTSAKRR